MKRKQTSQLYDKDNSVKFYEERYTEGYMVTWSDDAKKKIAEVIRSLNLPQEGKALDFGCGNGVMTDVLKNALPSAWEVYGTDISTTSIENAKKLYPHLNFFAEETPGMDTLKFDFLFTHHVLEHVYNLESILTTICNCLKPSASMLHILPCGNPGSFEHSVCLLRINGIDANLENRFFFEDEGHVRRMKTDQLKQNFQNSGFVLEQGFYGNHYFGALNWITNDDPSFINSFTDNTQSVDTKASAQLNKIRKKLTLLRKLRFPAIALEKKLRIRDKSKRDIILILAGLLLYIFSKPVDLIMNKLAWREWSKRKKDKNGSEMYLYFTRKLQ